MYWWKHIDKSPSLIVALTEENYTGWSTQPLQCWNPATKTQITLNEASDNKLIHITFVSFPITTIQLQLMANSNYRILALILPSVIVFGNREQKAPDRRQIRARSRERGYLPCQISGQVTGVQVTLARPDWPSGALQAGAQSDFVTRFSIRLKV